MSGRIRHIEAGHRRLPWLYSILGLSLLGWAAIAAFGYALGAFALRMAG